jgi:hypothetical protein
VNGSLNILLQRNSLFFLVLKEENISVVEDVWNINNKKGK